MRTRQIGSTLAALLIVLLSKSAAGQEDTPEQQAQRNAESDGAAIALAVYCSVPAQRVVQYKRSLMLDSMSYAKEHNVAFPDSTYGELAKAGYMRTFEFMRLLTPTPTNRKENCDAVDKEIEAQLQKGSTQ